MKACDPWGSGLSGSIVSSTESALPQSGPVVRLRLVGEGSFSQVAVGTSLEPKVTGF